MKEQAMPTTMTEDEKDREALATRMREAIIRELIPKNDDRTEEELFKGMDQRMVLGAIADLAASLIVYANEADGSCDCDWPLMAHEVSDELRKWADECGAT
jgi:hypothetical protein